jgi:hypothetical protein
MSPIAQSTTEQRAQVPIAHSFTQHGQGSQQNHRFHEPLVRARAADRCRPRFQRGADTLPENSHAVHHRRHSVGRVVTRARWDLRHRLVRPCAAGCRDRAVRRGAARRAAVGIAAPNQDASHNRVGEAFNGDDGAVPSDPRSCSRGSLATDVLYWRRDIFRRASPMSRRC